ncbi:MAG: LON peptidase substrate-binding domain-containing protein [Phycisphaerales bacterium]|nr:LON peptidase substrate-binding domain-containing protein [Phycisphaerales bacterium]
MSEEFVYVPSIVPVFPLPGVVLFPHTILPLHIFEPRYRQMFADAIAGDSIVAVALLRPGWEPLYHTPRAPIHRVVGVGRVVQHELVAEGNYNVLLRGVGRAVVLEELQKPPYRRARIQPLETFCHADEESTDQMRATLFATIRDHPAVDRKLCENWLKLEEAPIPLDVLIDLLGAGLPAGPELRQCILDEPDAMSRAEIVLTQLQTLAAIAENSRRQGPMSTHSQN